MPIVMLYSLRSGLIIVISCAGRGGCTPARSWRIDLSLEVRLPLEEVADGELIPHYEVRYSNTFLSLLVSVFMSVELRVDGTEL